MNAVAHGLDFLDECARLERRDVLTRTLRSAPRLTVVSGGRMSVLDHVVPQATQLPLLNRMVEMVVLGEENLSWLQRKIGFKSLRNVHYYLEAARWARLIEEEHVLPTSLGRRYVRSRFDPRVVLEGVRGRAFFEEVMRLTDGGVPTPDVVAGVLRRWSFRYSKSTVTRRAGDFCTLFGRIVDEAANPKERKLVVHSAWIEPYDILAINGVVAVWPALQLTPIKGIRRRSRNIADNGAAAQLQLPLMDVS